MPVPELIHHSGWPWPLEAVQDWFDSLWNWIQEAANAASAWLYDSVFKLFSDVGTWLDNWFRQAHVWISDIGGWLYTGIFKLFGDVGTWLDAWFQKAHAWISDVGGWIWNQISPKLADIWGAVAGFAGWLDGEISGLGGWLWSQIEPALAAAWTGISDGLTWVGAQVNEGAGWVAGEVKTMFDGAVAGFGAAIMDAVSGLGAMLSKAFEGTIDWFWTQLAPALGQVAGILTDRVLTPIWEGLQWLQNWIVLRALDMISGVENLFKGHSHISPEDAFALAPKVILAAAGMGLGATAICSVAGIKVMGTGLPVGEIGSYIKDLVHPSMFITATLGTLLGVALITPLRYQYNKLFTPLIPPIMDLIRFVVREVIKPDVFYDLAGYHGYSRERAEWYWEAHWVMPSFGNIVDAFHRGVISEAERDTYFILHDYKPEPRPGIRTSDQRIMASVVKTLIPRVDLRYAWELGQKTDEELVDAYRTLGYEDDSELMAAIQMARALVEEVHKVRDQWLTDFLKGHILEGTLRANLAVIGIGPARIDYYVIYAKKRREREHNERLLDIYDDAYFKDLKTYEELRVDAEPIIVDTDALELFLTEAYIRKYKKPKVD